MKLKEAFFVTPGPSNLQDAVILYFKGLLMGAADIVPGVSGGTVALIVGIYTRLLEAIQSFDLAAIKRLARLDLSGALAGVHLRFLLILVSGIATSIISLAHVMNWLLEHQAVYTWSAFFGLIAASTVILGRKIPHWLGGNGVAFGVGFIAAWIIVGLIPVQTPETWWFIILSGAIGICAMILPGISGAFLLLILGKYVYITGALRDPFAPGSLTIILLFILGMVLGITGFSRILTWMLHRWHMLTLAFLTGLMTGSMRKIWPWKEALETIEIRGKLHVLTEANVLPPLDSQLYIAIAIMVVSLLATLYLEGLVKDEN